MKDENLYGKFENAGSWNDWECYKIKDMIYRLIMTRKEKCWHRAYVSTILRTNDTTSHDKVK